MNRRRALFLWIGLALAGLLLGCSQAFLTQKATLTTAILATHTLSRTEVQSTNQKSTVPSTTSTAFLFPLPTTPPIIHTEDAQGNEVIGLNGDMGR